MPVYTTIKMKMRVIGSIGSAIAVVGLIGVYVSLNPLVGAAELTNDSPNPGDMFSLDQGFDNPPQQQGGVAHMLKWETVAQVRETALGVYYNSPGTSSRNITIGRGSGNGDSQCLISSVKNDNGGKSQDSDATPTTGSFNRGDTDVIVKIEGAPGSVKQWSIPIKNVCANLYQSYSLDGITLDDSELGLTGKYKATVTVAYSPIFGVDGTGDWRFLGGSLTNSFNFTVGAGPNAIVGALKTENSQTFGLRSAFFRGDPPKGVFFKQQFGFRCDETDVTNRRVKLYDPDINVFGDTYIKVTKGGNPLSVGEYNRSLDENVDFNSGSFYSVNGTGGWIRATATTGTSSIVINTVEPGANYKFWVINPLTANHVNGGGAPYPPNGNVLSVNIPNDSIYGDIDCNYKLTPEITGLDQSTYVYYPDVRVDARIVKSGDGPVPESHAWEIYAVRFPGAPNTDLRNDSTADNPCGASVMPAGAYACQNLTTPSRQYPAESSFAINRYNGGGPDSVGTRLCFFARVQNPTNGLNDNNLWAYSDMRCSMSVKKPRAQFLGSDLRVGSSPSATGNAVSTYYNVQGNNYGSWVEYGMFTKGTNSIVSSGNGLRGGNADTTVSNWNRLTFANTPSYGGYSPVPAASSAYAYFRNLPASGGNFNQGNPTTGVYDLGGNASIGNLRVSNNGQSIILRAGNLRILNDIIVDNNNVTSASNLSQVVIVADSIEFGNSSNRADAWLITSPTGYIDTCGIGVQVLTSGTCSNVLTVNGPVYTNQLKLRRTGGGNPPTAAQLAEPAERFNLRPDAQLWAYTYANRADYAQTDFVQELPPRY